jgi:hypothetical protein
VSLVAIDKGRIAFDRIKPQITAFMGEVFEKLCIEYMWTGEPPETIAPVGAGRGLTLPFQFQRISRWWGNNPDLKSQTEIDFIAYSDDEEQAIFGECKWRNEELDKSIIEGLLEKCRMFGQFKQKHYYLFSKSGFTSGAHEFAGNRDDIKLINFEDMW